MLPAPMIPILMWTVLSNLVRQLQVQVARLPAHRIWPNTFALVLLRSKGNDRIYIQRAPGRNPTGQKGNRH
jgi:hypothetical protein